MTVATTVPAHRLAYARIASATAAAAATSAGLNELLRRVAIATFDIPQPEFEPLIQSSVLLSSVLGAAAGGLFFAVLLWLTRHPMRIWLTAACLMLMLSMVPVLAVTVAETAPHAGVSAGATLAVMHLVVAAALMSGLWWAHRSGASRPSSR